MEQVPAFVRELFWEELREEPDPDRHPDYIAIRILESDQSGAVTMEDRGLASYGDAEVYLKINYQSGAFRYLSAPLHTPVEVLDVDSLELNILFLVGPPGTPYRALVNAHCVYEIL